MFMRKVTAFVLAVAVCRGALAADSPNLGKPITAADITAWDSSILPDGRGLHAGSGTAEAMNAQTLPKVRMPNRDGFIVRFPEKS
jgi:hypothetical protein